MMKLIIVAAILAVATALPSNLADRLALQSVIHGEPDQSVSKQSISEEDEKISQMIHGVHLQSKFD